MLRLMFLILLPLALSVDEWELIDVQNLRETIGDTDGFYGDGVLSPDGSHVAWTDHNRLCLYTFDDETSACYAPFEDDISLAGLAWSPDSQRIAFTEWIASPEGSLYLLNESDVWVFDLTDQRFTNRTEDGVSGVWNTETDWLMNPSIGLDLAPAWNPATGDLLYFSITEQTLTLFQLHEESVELLFVITFDLSVSLGTSPFIRLSLLSAVVSPDGSQVAITWLPAEGDWGIFLLDMANTGTWRHLVDAEAFMGVGIPNWTDYAAMIPYHVEWAREGLLINTYNDGFEDFQQAAPSMAYFVTLPQGNLLPLVDMSAVPDMMSMQHPDDTGLTPIAQLPRAAVVAPDGVTAFYFHFDLSMDYAAVSAVALPPDGTSPVLLGEIPDFECCALRSVSSSENGQMFTYSYLFTFAR
jgi:hypothetical protein